jgi:hypothetical protein
MMRFETNDVACPTARPTERRDDLSDAPTRELLTLRRRAALAEANWRLAMPLFVGILADLRDPARAQRTAPAAVRADPVRPAGRTWSA